jgi:hypothetical protein
VQYGTGAASNFSGPGIGMTIPTPSLDTAKSKQFLVTEQIVLQCLDPMGVVWSEARSISHQTLIA